jgi:hypothetical protein
MNVITANTCKTCKHSWTSDGQLFCRRYPPTVGFVPGPNGPMPISTYAPIHPDQTCGEYKPKIALEN